MSYRMNSRVCGRGATRSSSNICKHKGGFSRSYIVVWIQNYPFRVLKVTPLPTRHLERESNGDEAVRAENQGD